MIDAETRAHLEWIEACLLIPGKSRAGLARAFGKHRTQITMLLNGERRLQVSEILKAERYFGVPRVATTRKEPARGVNESLFLMGHISNTAWPEPREQVRTTVQPLIDERYAAKDQHLYAISEASPDGEFRPRDQVIAVAFDAYRTTPLHNDLVVRRTVRADMINYSLWRARVSGKLIAYEPIVAMASLSADGRGRPASAAIANVALVIARLTPLTCGIMAQTPQPELATRHHIPRGS